MYNLLLVVLSAILAGHCTIGGKYGDDMLGSAYFLINLKVEAYILPFLNYSTMMLEPYIDAATGQAHYEGHHDIYRGKTNKLRKQWNKEYNDSKLAQESILYHLQNLELVPKEYRTEIKNQGGGFVNHCLYFGIMSPNLEQEKRQPEGYLMEDITKKFESWEIFQQQFEQHAMDLFGSGYVWLSRKSNGDLHIVTSTNQDSPINDGEYPVLVLDMWEHAYYLQHKFNKKQYVKNWWNVVDWNKVVTLEQFWEQVRTTNPDNNQKTEL